MCELYTTPEMLTFCIYLLEELEGSQEVCRTASKEYLTRLHKFFIDWRTQYFTGYFWYNQGLF